MHAYRYGVFNLNRKTEIESCEPPERFLEMAEKFHEVFGLDLPNYEIWQEDGAWMPLYGVDESLSQTVLFPDVIDTNVNKGKNADVVGKKLVSNYKGWTREVRAIEKHNARRESDQLRLDVLNKNIERVNRLVDIVKENSEFKKGEVVRMFERMIENEEKHAYISLARKMNMSVATLYRLEKRIIRALGECGMSKLTSRELDDLLRIL